MNDKIIGIIGGMGPEASANFYLKIIQKTKVNSDQDHFRVIIDSNSKIPDRTKAIMGIGESPIDAIIATAKNLEKLGVDVICIPCITSHYFIDDIQSKIDTTILNAIVVLGDYIKVNHTTIKKVGILATDGSIKTGIYNKYLEDFQIIYPSADDQQNYVMESIYGEKGIKKGFLDDDNKKLLLAAGKNLVKLGAQVIISGCTEIGLVVKDGDLDVLILDPMDTLALEVTKNKEL